jgi:hypothetical protein
MAWIVGAVNSVEMEELRKLGWQPQLCVEFQTEFQTARKEACDEPDEEVAIFHIDNCLKQIMTGVDWEGPPSGPRKSIAPAKPVRIVITIEDGVAASMKANQPVEVIVVDDIDDKELIDSALMRAVLAELECGRVTKQADDVRDLLKNWLATKPRSKS